MKTYLNIILSFLLTLNTAFADNIFYNPVQIKNNLTVTGNTSVQGVTASASTITGSQSIGGGLLVTGASTLTGTANINGNLLAASATTLSGITTIANTLTVSGPATFSSNLNSNGPFVASGANTLSGLTTVSNTLTSNSTINSNGAFVAAGANTLTGPTTVGNTLTLTSGAPIISSSTASIGSSSVAAASSILDLTSTTKGMLPPRMTSTERDAIGSPATGLTIYNTTTNSLNAYNGTAWVAVGSGSGSGRTNNITGDSTDLENTIGNWVTFDDGGSLVDGTGGSPSVITITRNTTTPLHGNGDLKVSHSAADGTGEGASLPVTSREADKSRVQEITFEYKTSAAYVDDVYEVWVYDVTNAQLIQLAPYKLKASTTPSVFKGIFQNSASSTSYRLILFNATNTATASDVYVDNIISGPPIYNYGLVGTDWKAWTPTGSFTNATYSGFYKRVGGDLHGRIKVLLTGTPGAADLTVSLPTGFTIDTDRISTFTQRGMAVGTASLQDVGTKSWAGVALYHNTNTISVTNASGTGGDAGATTPFTFANTDVIGIDFVVPILGWSSNVQLSDDADLRIVAAQAKGDPASAAANAPIIAPTESFDTHNAYNNSTGIFTAPQKMYLKVHGYIESPTADVAIDLYVNSSPIVRAGKTPSNGDGSFSGIVSINANDTVYVGTQTGGGIDASDVYLNFEKIQGPSAIAATDTIQASYYLSGNFATTASIPVNYDTKIVDTHGAVTTSPTAWRFTAPVKGFYLLILPSYDASTTVHDFANLYKNGSVLVGAIAKTNGATSGNGYGQGGGTIVQLNAGDYIDIRGNTTIRGGALTGGNTARIDIMRLGL